MERGDIVGLVGAITSPEETIYSAAFGERKLGSGVAMTEDTVCNMASMTKAITGACAMQLVEQGKLDLDLPISTWLPDAAELQVLDGWDGDKPVLRAPERRDHAAPPDDPHLGHGLRPGTPTSEVRYGETSRRGLPAARLRRSPRPGRSQPLMFDPGERWDYGSSIDWIGRLIVSRPAASRSAPTCRRTSSSRSG